jgi:DNA invertase Pin-like site-specific DNA recombinase
MATVRPGDAVIVLDISRLGRRAKEVLGALEFFKESYIRFVSIRQQLDSSTLTGQFTFSILACVNEMMANDAKQRTKLALDYKKARQEKLGGAYVPFGYDCPDGKKLVPNSREYDAILAISKLHAAGWSLRAIGGYLSERGIKTKSGHTHWHPETIRKLIRRIDRTLADAKAVEVSQR